MEKVAEIGHLKVKKEKYNRFISLSFLIPRLKLIVVSPCEGVGEAYS